MAKEGFADRASLLSPVLLYPNILGRQRDGSNVI